VTVATGAGDRVVVMLTSPLEPEHVERIAGAFPDQIEVIFRPDLMPAPRYVADHGDPSWRRNPAQEREWHRLLGQAEVLLDFPPHEPRPLLELAPKLRWVQTTSAGVGPLVQRLGLQDSHLIVTTSSGIHAQALAEFVFAALLYRTKEIGRLVEEQRTRQWNRFAGVELAGQTMAIIGPGRIGREVARIARAFRMRVAALARDCSPGRAESLGVDQVYSREELHLMLAEADCLVVCAPLTPETEDLLGEAEFVALKRGAVFVNIGRGAIVDEDALLAALDEGRVSRASLDVAEGEPLPAGHPLYSHPKVKLTPHLSNSSSRTANRTVQMFTENLARWRAGEPLQGIVDPAVGY